MSSPWKRSALAVIGVVSLALVLALGRAVVESRAELAAATAYHEKGDLPRAIEHYRRALRWTFPWSPYVELAMAGLEARAAEAESQGEVALALLAWRSLLGGLSATHSFFRPHHAAASRAKDHIARLMALPSHHESDAIDGTALDPTKHAREARRTLDSDIRPDPFWGTMLLMGFTVWIASLVQLARRAFDEEGHFRWESARAPSWAAFAGLLVFVLGLSFA